jgi:hypothetical protein
MKERVDARRFLRAYALDQRPGGRRRFAGFAWREPRLFDALVRDLLFVRPIGTPQFGSVDRLWSGLPLPG